MSYKIKVNAIKSMMKIGVTQGERNRLQEISTNVIIDANKPIQNNNEITVIDYSKIVSLVQDIANDNSFKLLEEFAITIKENLLNIDGINDAKVIVCKVNAPIKNIDSVSVEV